MDFHRIVNAAIDGMAESTTKSDLKDVRVKYGSDPFARAIIEQNARDYIFALNDATRILQARAAIRASIGQYGILVHAITAVKAERKAARAQLETR